MPQMVIARDAGAFVGRDALVLRHLEAALNLGTGVEVRDVRDVDGSRPSPPGFQRIRPPTSIIALGRAAHVRLADVEKSTIFVGDLDLESADADIERVMWSSVNTIRAVGLGAEAWESMQLLPFEALSTHPMPPLRMDAAPAGAGRTVRIILHGKQPAAAAAGALLGKADFTVVEPRDPWCDDASIHVHVGSDLGDESQPRVVDSWASGRLTIRLAGRGERPAPSTGSPYIEHETNGLACQSLADIVVACREVDGDPTFRAKLVKAGQKTVAPLLKGWGVVADALCG